LEAGDAAFVAVQGSNELAGRGVPDFYGSVAGSGNDVLLVKIDDIDGSSMADLRLSKK
jgi:hypothetical protein